jgi:uncharacterized protein (DUF433 family)
METGRKVDYYRWGEGFSGYDEGMATIISDPEIMMGKPVVAGTRITVELILEKLAAGETTSQILAAHPHLTHDGIRAAVSFASVVGGKASPTYRR